MARNFRNDAVHIEGLDALDDVFTITGPKVAKRVMRNATTDIARDIAKSAKQKAPKDTGTLRKAIKAKRRKGSREEFRATVSITQGKGEKHDAFYWRFVEFGTAHSAPKPFMRPAFDEMKRQINTVFGDKVKARILREVDRVAKK